MSKILFICEGEKAEKKFCNLIIDKYFNVNSKEKEYVAFGTNIYGLYDELIKDYGLDVTTLITLKAKEKRDMYNYSKLLKGNFAETFLIFDFDPQSPQYSSHKIKKMIKYFDNETENGKLYINYPMLESFKHFKHLPDLYFNNYVVKLEDCINYKEYVSKISCINHFGLINEEQLKIIVAQNLKKYNIISNSDINDYNDYLANFSQLNLLNVQLESINNNNELYVLNSSVFWGIDYYGENLFNKYFKFNQLEVN